MKTISKNEKGGKTLRKQLGKEDRRQGSPKTSIGRNQEATPLPIWHKGAYGNTRVSEVHWLVDSKVALSAAGTRNFARLQTKLVLSEHRHLSVARGGRGIPDSPNGRRESLQHTCQAYYHYVSVYSNHMPHARRAQVGLAWACREEKQAIVGIQFFFKNPKVPFAPLS